jgi:hypothetical protein
MRGLSLTFAALLLAACGGDSGPEMLEGFTPEPPAADEIQIVSPIIHDVQPGQDVLLCSYLPLDQALLDTIDVVGTTGFQSAIASHHAVLYTVTRERPVDTHECTDDDMINISFAGAAGGGGQSGQIQLLPEGVAFRMEAGHQLMVQSHWINTSPDQPIDGQAAFNLKFREPSDSVQLAQLFTWLTTDISVPANSTGSAHTDCEVQDDMSFYQIAGHAHERATRVRLTQTPAGGSPNQFYDQEWAEYMTFDPPFQKYAAADAMQIHAGDTLTVDCDYDNETGEELQFPTEMCVGVGFFFPGDHQINCVDGSYDDR